MARLRQRGKTGGQVGEKGGRVRNYDNMIPYRTTAER